MDWIEVRVSATHEATEAVAHLFYQAGAAGVVIEDPVLVEKYRNSGEWDYVGLARPQDMKTVYVTAYLPDMEGTVKQLAQLQEGLNGLASYGLSLGNAEMATRKVQSQDWENTWKEYFHPFRLGHRLVVKPSWEDYVLQEGDLLLELDPGMAFGTGTHATTSMCAALLEDCLRQGMDVLDLGTGSGILAIAAAKLGAGRVEALDIDPLAVKIAGENIRRNQVENQVLCREGNVLDGLGGRKFDLVLANIIADVILPITPAVPAILKEDGLFIASGIIKPRLPEIREGLAAAGFILETEKLEKEWAALVARRGTAE